MANKDTLVELAKLAEHAERYEDMADFMKQVTSGLDENDELSSDERNLLSVAYKNVIGSKRTAWRVVSAFEQKHEENEVKKAIGSDYRKKIENELETTCKEVLTLLKEKLVPSAVSVEAKVFYLKMQGDYYRYMAEAARIDNKQAAIDGADDAYKKAKEKAEDGDALSPCHPIRLGLALNFSVFCFEIQNNPDEACKLARTAFDNSIKEMEKQDKTDNKESTLIMQLLRDNLTLWTQDDDDQETES